MVASFPAATLLLDECGQGMETGNANQESTDCVQSALRIAGLTSSFTVYPDVDAVIDALGGND